MIASVGRVLRLSFAVAFVSGLGFVATSARAGALAPIDVTAVCADPNSVVDNYLDPATWASFNGVKNCKSICKSFANKCKSDVKKNYSCINGAISDNSELIKKADCETLSSGSDQKDCKQTVNSNEKDAKNATKSQKQSDLSLCDSVKSDCTTTCEAPPVL
jgi:hypothetical protein